MYSLQVAFQIWMATSLLADSLAVACQTILARSTAAGELKYARKVGVNRCCCTLRSINVHALWFWLLAPPPPGHHELIKDTGLQPTQPAAFRFHTTIF
jgi:Na+-driven multidrug efflux pump